MNVHGRAAAEVGAVFERAGEVARQLESSVDLAPPLAGLWLFHLNRGQFARAEEIVDELFNVARNLDNRDILLQAHHAAWSTGLFRGQFTDARTHVDAGLALYDEARHAGHRFLYLDHDPAVCALSLGRCCGGSSATRSKGYTRNTMQSPWRDVCSMRRRWLKRSILLAMLRLCEATLQRLRQRRRSCSLCAGNTG